MGTPGDYPADEYLRTLSRRGLSLLGHDWRLSGNFLHCFLQRGYVHPRSVGRLSKLGEIMPVSSGGVIVFIILLPNPDLTLSVGKAARYAGVKFTDKLHISLNVA